MKDSGHPGGWCSRTREHVGRESAVDAVRTLGREAERPLVTSTGPYHQPSTTFRSR